MASLQRAAISSDKLDVTMLVELARMLHARLEGIETPLGTYAETIPAKETDSGIQNNFDRSESFLLKYENAIIYKRGNASEKTSQEDRAQDKGFQNSGVGFTPDEMLRHEIGLLFFPAQPLVTPALVDKIKRELGPA